MEYLDQIKLKEIVCFPLEVIFKFMYYQDYLLHFDCNLLSPAPFHPFKVQHVASSPRPTLKVDETEVSCI